MLVVNRTNDTAGALYWVMMLVVVAADTWCAGSEPLMLDCSWYGML